MKLVEISDIKRKESLISYIRTYLAKAVFQEDSTKSVEIPIEFKCEHAPTGDIHISVSLLKEIDYPVADITQMLKHRIAKLEKEGSLN